MTTKHQNFPPTFLEQVRKACRYYNKPEQLQQLLLARVALRARLIADPSYDTKAKGRVTALQQAISISLQRLKDDSTLDRREDYYLALYYYIHKQDPQQGTRLKNVAAYVESHPPYIPRSTFQLWLKKDALHALAYHLSLYLAQQTNLLEPIPLSTPFVGRKKPLKKHYQHLTEQHLSFIHGAAGIGKTALGAQVAAWFNKKTEQPVCWLTLKAGLNDNPTAILHAWAAFLAQQGYPQLWAFVHHQTQGAGISADALALLKTGLLSVKPLLCVDNLNGVGQEAVASLLKSTLALLNIKPTIKPTIKPNAKSKPQANSHQTAMLLISQHSSSQHSFGFLSALQHPPLKGLPTEAVSKLVQPHFSKLTPLELKSITKQTAGNPQLLHLWLSHRRLTKKTAIGAKTNVSELLIAIMAALSEGEKRAAYLLSLSRHAINYTLLQDPPDDLLFESLDITPADFNKLYQHGLLFAEVGDGWRLSPLIAHYLPNYLLEKGLITPQEIAHFHRCLADLHSYYLSNLPTAYLAVNTQLEVIYHLNLAAETEQVVNLLLKQYDLLVEHGHGPALRSIINQINTAALNDANTQEAWHKLKRNLFQLLGDYEAAKAEAEAVKANAETDAAKLWANQALGDVAKRQGQFQQAADYYQKALASFDMAQETIVAHLHRDLAWVLMEQNKLDEAWYHLQQARLALQSTLAQLALQQGAIEQAQTHFQQAVKLAAHVASQANVTAIWQDAQRVYIAIENTLGVIERRQGNFSQSLKHLKQAEKTATQLGERRELARVLNNLGLLYQEQERFDLALTHYQANLTVVEALGSRFGQAITLLNIGLCHLEQKQYAAAISTSKQALLYFIDLGDVKGQVLAHSNLAEAYLKANTLSEAKKHSQQALALNNPAIPPADRAESLHIYAKVLLAEGNCEAAYQAAQKALALLCFPDNPKQFTEPQMADNINQTLTRIQAICDEDN